MGDVKDVGPVAYEYEATGHSGGSTGLTLDNSGFTSAHGSGGNGWLAVEPEKEIYHFLLQNTPTSTLPCLR